MSTTDFVPASEVADEDHFLNFSFKNLFSLIAPGGDVEKGTGIGYSERPGHKNA